MKTFPIAMIAALAVTMSSVNLSYGHGGSHSGSHEGPSASYIGDSTSSSRYEGSYSSHRHRTPYPLHLSSRRSRSPYRSISLSSSYGLDRSCTSSLLHTPSYSTYRPRYRYRWTSDLYKTEVKVIEKPIIKIVEKPIYIPTPVATPKPTFCAHHHCVAVPVIEKPIIKVVEKIVYVPVPVVAPKVPVCVKPVVQIVAKPVYVSTPVMAIPPVPCFCPDSPSCVVVVGDSWYAISQRIYGNPELWPILAQHNQMAPTAYLTVGQTILLPSINQDGTIVQQMSEPIVQPGHQIARQPGHQLAIQAVSHQTAH